MVKISTVAYGKNEQVRTLTLIMDEVRIGYSTIYNGIEHHIEGWGLETGLAGIRNNPDREKVFKVTSVEDVRDISKKFKANALKAGLEYIGRIDTN